MLDRAPGLSLYARRLFDPLIGFLNYFVPRVTPLIGIASRSVRFFRFRLALELVFFNVRFKDRYEHSRP